VGALAPLDAAIVVAYFVGITAFGAAFGRTIRSTRDFFLAGRRLPAWLVAFSCVATTVGSYSFVKYSAAGFRYGLSSSQTYLNDWFWMPLFLFGWLPVLYHLGIVSVPEYFQRRFDRPTGLAATFVLLVYLVGYIGINLFTMGTALGSLFGLDLFDMAVLVTALCMVYEMSGGQTSVVFTDFVQGILLLLAGAMVLGLGILRFGGVGQFFAALPVGHATPFPPFNEPAAFNFVGIFWQDGLAGGVAFYFMNQGMMLRFLSARSLRAARTAAGIVLVVLMPLAAVAVSGAGWVGSALASRGEIAAGTPPDEAFMAVTRLLCGPGVFGLVLAALLAALMSTADTLINAVSAVLVNDLYRPYLRPGRDDGHYLRAARWMSLVAGAAGLALVPVYRSFGTIYEAHAAFIAAVTPPMVVAILLALTWPRYTSPAALGTLGGGTALMFLSLAVPSLVSPFDHGVPPEGYVYVRACYGLAVSAALGVALTFVTRRRPRAEVEPLTLWGLGARPGSPDRARWGLPKLRLRARLLAPEEAAAVPDVRGERVALPAEALGVLSLAGGEEVFVDDARWWFGGLRSARCEAVRAAPSALRGTVGLPGAVLERNGWREGQPLVIEVLE
jgi:SSS family solute:Na+ symporter